MSGKLSNPGKVQQEGQTSMLEGRNFADIVIFLGMLTNAVMILIILYFFVF